MMLRQKATKLSSKNENHKVFYHKVGTPQSADILIYEDPGNPQRFHQVGTTEDERFAILNISERGKGKKATRSSYGCHQGRQEVLTDHR